MEGNSTTTIPHGSPFPPEASAGAAESAARVSALLAEAQAIPPSAATAEKSVGMREIPATEQTPATRAVSTTVAPAPATPARRNTGAHGRGRTAGGKYPAPAAPTPATPTDPSVSISLPKEVYDYFAAEAEKDERTLAKFVARIVRADYSRRIREAATEAAARGIFNSDAAQ